ncbi:MALRD1 [Branchiostoma lanceolatum]|uniref:MALRD1 protein n=1 Tax=Branchiostoma lanceolatum TaxID=7740 RepID=A0A8J9VYM3_BRALA|nr:MALRD1 [Branchiostoma lanceolatum]
METRHPVPCDFESVGICEWHQQTDDDFDWSKQSSQTERPDSSNTQAGDTGRFLYISTDEGQQPSDTARIISPVIVPSVVRPCNMTFSHYQSGPDAGDLDIFTRTYYTGIQTTAWQESARTSGMWETETVPFSLREPFQVIIQGVVGYGRDAVLAVDDISFSWDCVREVDGSVRLVDGASFDEGRVEIYYNHRWGTICNIGWTQTSADVVCAQLGYKESVWTDTRYPGPTSTPVLLDEVTCDSTNTSKITDCRTKEWGHWDRSCNQDNKDVSVRCVGQWHQCRADEFVCDNAVCLPETTRCDFTDDCGDRSDESDCSSYPGRCDFQNDFCSWVQDKNDSADWTRGFGGSEAGVPLVDHEGRTDFRYFLYVTGGKPITVSMTLPTYFVANGSACSMLLYYVFNANDASVTVRMHMNTSTVQAWRQNVHQGPTWMRQEVLLTNENPFQVSIESSIVTSAAGSIAIDDVTFTPGCLIERTGCNETSHTFECGSGECISVDHVCDFQENCADGSDERNCTNRRCDFEDGFCSWSRGTSDNIQFERGRETTSTGGTGPSLDHTHQNPLGYYAFIDASGRHPGQKAQLVSPFFAGGLPCQFRFFYHMQGRDIGKLRVLLLNESGIMIREVWERDGQQGRGWLYGSVSLRELDQYQVILEATVGNGDQGDVAVDDLSFATFCVEYNNLASTVTTFVTRGEVSSTAPPKTTLRRDKSSVKIHLYPSTVGTDSVVHRATTTQPITSKLPVGLNSSQSSGLSITVGIASSGSVLFVIAIAFAGFMFIKKRRKQHAADRDRLSSVTNPAFDEEIYDVIRDEGFIGVAALPPPVPPPLKSKDNDYLDTKRLAIEDPNGYEVPSTLKRAAPTDPITNHIHKPGYQPGDAFKDEDDVEYLDLDGLAAKDLNGFGVPATLPPVPPAGPVEKSINKPGYLFDNTDIDHDYTYPGQKIDPYQPLGGSYEHHHEYQGLRNQVKNNEQSQDTDHDYTYPVQKTHPYQPLRGSYQHHHEYQGLSNKLDNQPQTQNTEHSYCLPNVVNISSHSHRKV